MIVYNLNVEGIGFDPTEADPPLVVDANAVLPRPIAAKSFQSVSWDLSQIGNGNRRLNVIELSLCYDGNTLKPPAELALEDFLGFLAQEGPDHIPAYCCAAFNATR